MADKPEKPTRRIEVAVFVLILIASIAIIFGGVAQMIPGLRPIAASGAGLIKPSDIVFLVLSAIAMVSAAGVAFSRNIIYSALALLGTLLSTGALYIYLRADYVAITQLLIYVGGVLVLVLFAVMLTSRIDQKTHSNPSMFVFPGMGLLAALIGLLGYVATKTPWKTSSTGTLAVEETVSIIGNAFLKEYLLPFEVISLVLLATLVGAVVIARK
ncbi:MAG: NADH-quinone oxidoreductase subunit J family protein [Myxococcaceae bacterium]